ncbi:MAG: PD40 domain-containing protein [Polyangiaceae bacterium]|jgi:hypothetical protein|nr:PD40 domain-containing protein [Polyangiaceae bacterium]
MDLEPEERAGAVPGDVARREPALEETSLRRRPLWPLLLGVVAVLAAGGAGLFFFLTRPDPFKVLVAVDVDGQWWEGSRPAAVLADRIGEGLKRIGFEPVAGGDPEVDRILSSSRSPEEAARRLGAGFVIHGSLAPAVVEHAIEDSTLVEARADATLHVRFVGDREGRSAAFGASGSGFGATKEEALAVLVDHVAERVFDAAVPKLLEHEVIRSKLESGDLEATVRLKDAKDYVALRARRLSDAQLAYDKVDQDRASSSGPPITYYGTFREQSYLAATGTSGALLLTADVSPFLHPISMDLEWSYRPEVLAWRSDDRSDRELWSGYHVMGVPSSSADGAIVAFVEDLYGHAKTLSVSRQGAAPKRLRVEPVARFDDLAVSPAGTYVALYERPCRQCASGFVIASLTSGEREYAHGPPQAAGEPARQTYYGFAWLDDHRLLLAHRALTAPPPPEQDDDEDEDEGPPASHEELMIVELGRGAPMLRLLVQLEPDESCVSPDGSRDGKRVVASCGGVLTFFDALTGERTETSEAGSDPTFSPSGAQVAFVRGGDLWLMSAAGGPAARLTENEHAENRPRFSPDGRRVYFQSQAHDPNIARRVTSVIASVEVP